MTPPEAPPPASTQAQDDDAIARMREERARLAAERSAGRRQRRRADQQFIGLVMICAVACFAIGLVIAKVVWKPNSRPPAAGKTVLANPPPVAAAPGGLTSSQPSGAAGQPTTGALPPANDQPAYDLAERQPIPIKDQKQFIDHMVKWRQEDPKFLAQRWDRYLKCIELGDLKTERAKEAFLATPREKFCREQNLGEAYAHAFLDLGHGWGQTISGPHIVCRMTDRLDPQPADRCLEIGTGSGYQAAMLANLSNHVYSIEIIEGLAKETEGIYAALIREGYDECRNVHLKAADGYYGWPKCAPFDKIVVTCAIDHIPPPLLKQLASGGVMIIPIGPPNAQRVLKITKTIDANGKVKLSREDLYPGRTRPIQFVPFTAEGGGTHFER